MTHDPNLQPVSVPPPLGELLARYLQRQAAAHASGLALPETLGEVQPFDAAPAQSADPRTAWAEAVAALRYFAATEAQSVRDVPPDWPALVAAQEPQAALAFCTGNYPQLVRNVQPLWQASDLARLCPTAGRPIPAPALLEWAADTAGKGRFPQALLAVGALRLAREFDKAEGLLKKHRGKVPAEWQAAWANEEAALAWHRGRADEAASLWQAQEASVPVLFNRGLAALFRGWPAEARAALSQAVAQLPEASAWHHLGRLYLALAESRG